jgi:hypothetical protein
MAFRRQSRLQVRSKQRRRRGGDHERTAPLGVATTAAPPGAEQMVRRAIKLSCHSCGLQPDVVLERLRPYLEDGYPTVLVGANGEVRPVGVPRLRPGRASGARLG